MPNTSQPAAVNKNPVLWRVFWGSLAAVVLIALVCYANTLAMGAVFNDRLTLSFVNGPDNRYASNLLLETLVRPLSQPWLRHSFIADEGYYGSAFGWYHLVNVFLHLSSCVAVYLLTFRLASRWRSQQITTTDPYLLAAAASVLLACHPLAAESATYISARGAVLCAANYLLALNCLVAAVLASNTWRPAFYVLTFVFGLMALGSGEAALTLPLACFVVFCLLRPKSLSFADWALAHPIVSGSLAALAITIPFTVVLGIHPAGVGSWYGMTAPSHAAYWATQAKAFFTYYLRCFFVPVGLSVDPPFARATGWSDPLAIAGGGVLIGLAAALYFVRERPMLVLSIALILLGFLPHALLQQDTLVADSAFYLSLSGCCIAGGWVFTELTTKYATAAKATFAGILCLVLGGLAICHNLDFRTDEALAKQTLTVNPSSPVGFAIGAEKSMADRQYANAIGKADHILSSEPNSPLALLIKGTALMKLGEQSAAEPILTNAVNLAQAHHLAVATNAKYALAECLIRSGKQKDAEKWIYSGIYDDPQNPRGFYVLGLMARSQHQDDKAISFLRKAFSVGEQDALVPLAESYLDTKQYDRAFRCAKEAIAELGTNQAKIVFAQAALAMNDLGEAETQLKEALSTNSHDARTLALLSLLYERKGDVALAQSYSEDANRIDPRIFSTVVLPAGKPIEAPRVVPTQNKQPNKVTTK